MHATRLTVAAAALLALEAVALVVVAGIELVDFFREGAASATTGVALIVLTLLTAVGLAVFAVAVLRGISWARSGGVVVHVLALIVAGWALTVDPPSPALALVVGIPGLVGLVLLLAVARAAGLAERADAEPGPDHDA